MSTLSYGLSGNISSKYLHVHTLYQNVVVATKMGVCMGKYTPIGSAGGLATAPTPPPPAGRCVGKWVKNQWSVAPADQEATGGGVTGNMPNRSKITCSFKLKGSNVKICNCIRPFWLSTLTSMRSGWGKKWSWPGQIEITVQSSTWTPVRAVCAWLSEGAYIHHAATDVPVRPDDKGDLGPSRAWEESSIIPLLWLQVRPSSAVKGNRWWLMEEGRAQMKS